MKKQLFLMSALAVCAMSATSCGNKPAEKLKVGLICLHGESSTYDKNFIEAFKSAVETSKEKGYIESSTIKTDIGEDENCSKAEEQLVNDGYRLIFTDSFGHDAYTHIVAEENPDIHFSSATGVEAKISGLNNFHNAFASIYEGRYLAGIAGAQYLLEHGHTNKQEAIQVGYVGAKAYAEVISGYTAWFLGIKSVFPNVVMHVKYTDSWYDETKEKEYAEYLIDTDKCILISQHADSMGAPNACKNKKVPNVSYNVNTSEVDPTCKDTYVAHSRINWTKYYEKLIESVSTGKSLEGEKEQNWTGSLSDGSVEYNVSSTLVSDTSLIETAEKELKEGTRQVFDTSTFTVNDIKKNNPGLKESDYAVKDGHLTKYMGDINFDEAYTRDTDLIAGGTYVKESYYRSAPAFDCIIDNIIVEG